jgi:Aminoglycoside phosphotransferase
VSTHSARRARVAAPCSRRPRPPAHSPTKRAWAPRSTNSASAPRSSNICLAMTRTPTGSSRARSSARTAPPPAILPNRSGCATSSPSACARCTSYSTRSPIASPRSTCPMCARGISATSSAAGTPAASTRNSARESPQPTLTASPLRPPANCARTRFSTATTACQTSSWTTGASRVSSTLTTRASPTGTSTCSGARGPSGSICTPAPTATAFSMSMAATSSTRANWPRSPRWNASC